MTRVKALGEIALRVDDLAAMRKFYQEVIGLELMRDSPIGVFFRIAEGYGGHTQVLALFDRRGNPDYQGVDTKRSTVDHFAFTISLADFDTEKERLERYGLRVETAEHKWVHWRSLYVRDPEGNEVELVCYDGSV
jgi:catechol 2,3-dioxygenase-like lactoylglutathione lyase family enzyme